jgi:hypothetical protein
LLSVSANDANREDITRHGGRGGHAAMAEIDQWLKDFTDL